MPKWVPNCAADVPVRGARARARARLVQEHQLHNWDPILASLEPGGPKNLRKPIKVNVNPSKTTKKDNHIGPRTWVFGPQNLGLGQMWSFWGLFCEARCCHVCFDSFGRGSHQK